MAKPTAAKTSPPGTSFFAKINDLHCIGIIAALVLLFFRKIILDEAYLWEDFIYQFYPFRSFAAVSLANGELPLWNPYTFNGMPFQADIQSALFYIPNLLLTLFVTGDRLPYYWLEISIILHYVLAGAGMFYLAKSYGLERVYALFSGLIYALSAFMIMHAIHQVIINQIAWLPLIVLLFLKTLRERSVVSMIITGVVLGHAILAGFPQLSLYIFFLLLLVFSFEFVGILQREGTFSAFRRLPPAAGVVLIAVGLTAIQILPTLELAPLSQRAEMTYERSLESSLYWEQLLTVAIPNFFGTHGAQGSTFWLTRDYSQYWETAFYLGIMPLACLIFALPLIRKDSRIAFLFGVALFSLLYALGDRFFLHKFFFSYVPGFDLFRSIGRMTLLFSFAGALLAGFGLRNMILAAQHNKKLCLRLGGTVGGLGIILWIAVQMGLFQPPLHHPVYQQVHAIAVAATTRSCILLLITSGVIFALIRGVASARTALIGLLILHFVDINMFAFEQNNGRVNPDDYYRRTEQLTSFLVQQGTNEYFRVNSRQGGAMILDRNQGMVDHIFLMEGYTPLALQRIYPPSRTWDGVCDLMNAKYRIAVDEQQQTMNLRQSPTYLPRAYMVYDAKVVANDDSLKRFMESERFVPSRTVVLEEEPLFRPDTSMASQKWSAKIASYGLNAISLDVATQGNGFLVLSEVYYPGWHAYLNGERQRILRANWNQRAIPIPAGTHTVNVVFEPERFYRGAMITGVTVGLSIVGVVYFTLRQRKRGRA